MTDRPILFSAPMVRALLGGRKTQTRRVLKPQPYPLEGRPGFWNASGVVGGRICVSDRALLDLHHKPKPGDRLYVREHWRTTLAFEDLRPSQMTATHTRIKYEAGGLLDLKGKKIPNFHEGRFRQAMHMPRWASRLTLIVTDVRVERLQDISEADAIAEGAPLDPDHRDTTEDGSNPHMVRVNAWTSISPVAWYHRLWNEINGPGAWEANPWVVAYTFTVHHGNIDEA